MVALPYVLLPPSPPFLPSPLLRGVGAMEIVAIDMKLRGMYMARQLSFCGVNFSICEVELTDKFVEAYDASVKLVRGREGGREGGRKRKRFPLNLHVKVFLQLHRVFSLIRPSFLL